MRREEFEGRAGCVFALDRPVEHREVVGRVVQLVPAVHAEAADGLVGVVARIGAHGQDVTRGGGQDHHRPARCVEVRRVLVRVGVALGLPGPGGEDGPFQFGLDEVLQVDVDGQHDVVAGDGGEEQVVAFPHDPTQAVDLDDAPAGHAAQVVLEEQFDARLADLVAQCVVLAPRGPAVPVLGVVEGPDPAEEVACEVPVEVAPHRRVHDPDARVLVGTFPEKDQQVLTDVDRHRHVVVEAVGGILERRLDVDGLEEFVAGPVHLDGNASQDL